MKSYNRISKNIQEVRINQPSYRQLLQNGGFAERVRQIFDRFSPCRICPWQCAVDRTKGEKGRCHSSGTIKVARAFVHHGEEPAISGTGGSGTIFFSNCNLDCCFCQNHQISHGPVGREISETDLASMMLKLQEKGCHNINLVSPTHYLPPIVSGLYRAARLGLKIPVVYNTNGYETIDTLKLLDGIIDIYLPDAKYGDNKNALKFSGAKNYTDINRQALREMFRQTGPLVTDTNGVALRGLIVRHLVLPSGVSDTVSVLTDIRETMGTDVTISLMGQYRPCYKASEHCEIDHRVSGTEYAKAVHALESMGFENGWIQQWDSLDTSLLPDFRKTDSWN